MINGLVRLSVVDLYRVNLAKLELCFPNLPLLWSSGLAWTTEAFILCVAERRKYGGSCGTFAFERLVQGARGHCSSYGYHLSVGHLAVKRQPMSLSSHLGTPPLPSLTPGQVLACPMMKVSQLLLEVSPILEVA